jgi:pimeloyl-ACP methyl ester carboxylesterase
MAGKVAGAAGEKAFRIPCMKQRVEFADVLGRRVFTILTEPDEPTDRLLIMSHGFRGESTGPAREFVDLERLLVADSIACLRFDQPCSGNSEGDFRDSSFLAWIDTIVELAGRHLDAGYRVALLGQSMGASATMIAASREPLLGRIPVIVLWVPDPKENLHQADRGYATLIGETAGYVDEGGQRVRSDFWREANQAGFFSALEAYRGRIHLVYGEDDIFVPPELRAKVIAWVEAKGQTVTVLPGKDHSSWDYDVAQEVYGLERDFLRTHLP